MATHHSWPKHKGRVFGLPNQDYQVSSMNGRASVGGKQSNDGISRHSSAGFTGNTLQWGHKLLVSHTEQGPEGIL